MDKWDGEVAVVTGASSGIGKSLAIKLAEHGMKVAALARRTDRLEELSSEFSGKGAIVGMECDVTDTAKIEEVFARIVSELGPIRVLVNNAGVGLGTKFSDFEIDKWRKMMEVNVFGLFECTKQVINAVKESGNQDLVQIININSVAGQHVFETNTDFYPYSVTKHCLTLLTKALMKQMVLDKLNIRITSIHPGVVRTEFFEAGDFFQNILSEWPSLHSDDIANACISALSAEPHVLITTMTVKPMGEII